MGRIHYDLQSQNATEEEYNLQSWHYSKTKKASIRVRVEAASGLPTNRWLPQSLSVELATIATTLTYKWLFLNHSAKLLGL